MLKSVINYRLIWCHSITNTLCSDYSKYADSIEFVRCDLFSQPTAPLSVAPGLTGSQKPSCENQWPSKPVSREEASRWDRLRRADRGEREAPLHKQGSAWPPSADSPRGLRSSGTEEKLRTTQPKAFHQNKQAGPPNFSIRAPRGGQEMDQCSVAPGIPRPSRADFGEEKEMHGVG